MSNAEIHIRPAGRDDADWITALAPRLHEFGPPPWREVAAMNAAVAAGLGRELANPSPGSAILAAVDPAGAPLGFISLRTDRDYFTEVPFGHVVDLVVARAGEGRGVGRAPLAYYPSVVIVEARAFTARIGDLLSDERYRALQLNLARRPDAGEVIPGTGGLRKVRWSGKGHGKRGGFRVIYFWHRASNRILMLFAFAKNERADLTAAQKKALRKIVEMEYR